MFSAELPVSILVLSGRWAMLIQDFEGFLAVAKEGEDTCLAAVFSPGFAAAATAFVSLTAAAFAVVTFAAALLFHWCFSSYFGCCL